MTGLRIGSAFALIMLVGRAIALGGPKPEVIPSDWQVGGALAGLDDPDPDVQLAVLKILVHEHWYDRKIAERVAEFAKNTSDPDDG